MVKLKKQLHKEYNKLIKMERQYGDASCGNTLLDYLVPELGQQRQKVQNLFIECKQSEPSA